MSSTSGNTRRQPPNIDNYIHHNQRAGREGYGVSINYGAYALIERNVFAWNRHAIKGGGDPGTGYAAYCNLVLKNGGYHDTYNAGDIPNWVALLSPAAAAAKALCVLGIAPSYTHYTHQFDMHGTETCGLGHLDCGDAGHSMYIRHKTGVPLQSLTAAERPENFPQFFPSTAYK